MTAMLYHNLLSLARHLCLPPSQCLAQVGIQAGVECVQITSWDGSQLRSGLKGAPRERLIELFSSLRNTER